jgi:hypothetical protein
MQCTRRSSTGQTIAADGGGSLSAEPKLSSDDATAADVLRAVLPRHPLRNGPIEYTRFPEWLVVSFE